jgi:hypothetical protein
MISIINSNLNNELNLTIDPSITTDSNLNPDPTLNKGRIVITNHTVTVVFVSVVGLAITYGISAAGVASTGLVQACIISCIVRCIFNVGYDLSGYAHKKVPNAFVLLPSFGGIGYTQYLLHPLPDLSDEALTLFGARILYHFSMSFGIHVLATHLILYICSDDKIIQRDCNGGHKGYLEHSKKPFYTFA